MTASAKNGDVILLTQSESLSNREVTDPLDLKDQTGTRHKETLAFGPGHRISGRERTRTADFTVVNPDWWTLLLYKQRGSSH